MPATRPAGTSGTTSGTNGHSRLEGFPVGGLCAISVDMQADVPIRSATIAGTARDGGGSSQDTRRIIALISILWLFLLIADILLGVIRPWLGMDYPPTLHARNAALWLGSWMVITPVVIAFARRVHPDHLGWGRALAAHALAMPFFILAHVGTVSVAVAFLVHAEGLLARWERLFFETTSRDLAVYAGVVGVFYLLDASTKRRTEATRAARLEAEGARLRELAAEARLDALRRELDPHFMANALNSVATCVREGERDQSLRMLEAIGELLRASYRKGHDVRVRLVEELDLLELYVGIERVRVGDRMSFEVDTDPQLMGALVPTLILQPLVENAVRHAVDRHTGHVLIRVEVRMVAGELRITVMDRAERAGTPTRSHDEAERIGLTNARERLHLLYDRRGRLDVRLDDPGGASVEVALPYEIASNGEER